MQDRTPLSDLVTNDEIVENIPNRVTLGSLADNPDLHPLVQFFDVDNIDRLNPQINEKMFYLLNYAMEVTGSKDRTDALLQLKGIKRFLGTSEKGKSLVDKMYRFARLDSKRQSVLKEIKLLQSD